MVSRRSLNFWLILFVLYLFVFPCSCVSWFSHVSVLKTSSGALWCSLGFDPSPRSEAKLSPTSEPGNVGNFGLKAGGRKRASKRLRGVGILFVRGEYQRKMLVVCNLCNLFLSSALKVNLLCED